MRQIWTLAGMKGMVVNSHGDYITRPIKTSFREGLSVLEYFKSVSSCLCVGRGL